MREIYRWFVRITGFANLVGGPAIFALSQGPLLQSLGSSACLFVTGGFLSFSGIALIWAAEAPDERAIIIFWEGVLRLWAALTFSVMHSWPLSPLVVLGDGTIGLLYIIGLFTVVKTGASAALLGSRSGLGSD